MKKRHFMATHTWVSDEARDQVIAASSQTTDVEFFAGLKTEKAECLANWLGQSDFFFCHWEAESQADIISTLTEKGLDEFIFTAVYPTISSGKNTKVIIISTPNGLNFFYRMWIEAQEGRSNYKLFEANWRAVPSRDDAWADETLANVGEKAFQQEYECDFLGSSNTLISTTKIKNKFTTTPLLLQYVKIIIYKYI